MSDERSDVDLTKIQALLPKFTSEFLGTAAGREHMAWFPLGRSTGRQNLAEAVQRQRAGEDVTDFVLTKLLPHADTTHNRQRGAWICIAPVVTRDIRQWFEGSGWAAPDDWPDIAALILNFVQSVTDDPDRLRRECEAFRESPHSKGFQSGFLSPILNTVRPDAFSLVNHKTRKAIRQLTGAMVHTALVRYHSSNAIVRRITADLGRDLPPYPLEGVLPGDVFDAFCHWYVAIHRPGDDVDVEDDAGADDVGDDVLDPAAVMRRFFPDENTKRRMCELMARRIEQAHAHSPSCWVTTVRRHRIRLNVGRLAVLDLDRRGLRQTLVPEDLPGELRDELERTEQWAAEFATRPVTRLCAFSVEQYEHLESVVEPSAQEAVRLAAQTGLNTPFQRFHAPVCLDFLEAVLGRNIPRPEFQPRSAKEERRQPGQKTAMESAVAFDPRQSLFHRVEYPVGHLVNSIELGEIGLPELQRPFVWDRPKVRDLFDSMFRGFPVGFLLLWSNAQLQTARQIGTGPKQLDVPGHLVVDGQQRLTSLFAVFRGATVLNSDFQPVKLEIAFRPRDGRFEVADAAILRDPEFIPNISVIWASRGGEFRFVKEFLQKLKEAKELRDRDEDIISDNISRLQNLINYQLNALVVHADVAEDHVADIFVRINNQGVRLEQADFIMTLLSVFWPEGRKELEEFARAVRRPPAPGDAPSPFNYLIQPGPDQMLRATIALGFYRGRMKAVYQILRGRHPETGQFVPEIRNTQFERLRAAQPKVLNLNDWHGYLHALKSAGFIGPDTISSENAVIFTYAIYLIGRHQCGVEEPELSRIVRRWFTAATLTARYSGSVESTMDADLADLKEASTPEAFVASLERKITTELTSDFWSITLPAALETSAALAPQWFAFRAAQVVLGVPVLFSDKKVRDLLDPAMRPPTKSIEQHHLFPRAWLRRHGITTAKRINQVANLALLEWPQNRNLGDLPPSQYVPRLRSEFSPAQWERMHHLHALPPGWESMEYEHFLEQRRKLMALVIKEAFEALGAKGVSDDVALQDATADERRVWPLVEELERRLRSVIRGKYNRHWGARADQQMAATLGTDAMATIERNRAKHLSAYRGAPAAEGDLLDYCYLGQLGQLMTSNVAWQLFQPAFRDKRELDDLLKAVIPVRNDLAHFRRVPGRELERCRMAVEDLTLGITKLT